MELIRSKKATPQLPSVIYFGGDESDSPEPIINAFDSYFHSVVNQPDSNNFSNSFSAKYDQYYMHIFKFTVDDVYEILKELSNKPTAGVDQIPFFTLKTAYLFLWTFLYIFSI